MTIHISHKIYVFPPWQVTYIGIHNRRNPEFIAHLKKNHNKKALKKSYFYYAMEEMRESYGPNVAFLYVSDDMKWGRKNIKVTLT